MAAIPGSVRVTGFIGPTDSTDTYAVTDAKYGRDGLRNVADHTERNAITEDRRRQGMVVGTDNDGKYWYLNPGPWAYDDTDWQLFLDPVAGSAYGLWDLSGSDIITSPSLTSPAVPNVLPANDSIQNLGSKSYRWNDLYLSGNIDFATAIKFIIGDGFTDDMVAKLDVNGISIVGQKSIRSSSSALQIDLDLGGGGDQFYITTDNGAALNDTWIRLRDGATGDFAASFGDGLGSVGSITINGSNLELSFYDGIQTALLTMIGGKTTINPRLDVTGAFYYTDGNEAAGRILVTDGTGLGIWTDPVAGLPQGLMNYIPVGVTVTVPANYQYMIYGNLTIDGTMINNGQVVIINGALVVNVGGTFTNNNTLEYATFQTGTNDSKYSQTFTTVANTPLTITHNLNTTDFVYSVKEGLDFIDAQVTIVDANNITITTTTAVTGKINIIGF